MASWLAPGRVPDPDVEDVALWICQGRPSRPVLVKFSDLGRAEGDRPLDLGRKVSRDEVKVHPILALARLGYGQEHQRGKVRSSDGGIIAKNWLAPSLTGVPAVTTRRLRSHQRAVSR